MAIVNYFYYDTINDFEHRKSSEKDTPDIFLSELIAYSLSFGDYGNFKSAILSLLQYTSLPLLLLDTNTGKYTASDTYKRSESSFKGAYSFFLGMLAAKLVANRKYNIRHLFHLTDDIVDYFPTGGLHPDFVGEEDLDTAHLFEAKGSSSSRKTSAAKDGKEQVNAIHRIRHLGRPGNYKNIAKTVVASSFPKNVWTIDDIDPEESGDVTLSLDFDKAMFLYYHTIMKLLLHDSSRSERTFSDVQYICIQITDELCVGLHKGCYDFFQEGYGQYFKSQIPLSQIDVEPERFYPGVYKEITSILSSFTPPEATETLSILPDGILCSSTL